MKKYCKFCGSKIPEGRLKALPNATTCVECSDTKKKVGFQRIEGKTEYSVLDIVDGDSIAAKDLKRMQRNGFNANFKRKPTNAKNLSDSELITVDINQVRERKLKEILNSKSEPVLPKFNEGDEVKILDDGITNWGSIRRIYLSDEKYVYDVCLDKDDLPHFYSEENLIDWNYMG